MLVAVIELVHHLLFDMKACFIACITGLLSAGVGVIVGPHITVYGGMVALVTYTISSYSEMHN